MLKTTYSQQEDDLIKQLYPRSSKEEILAQIPKKWNSIVRRAERLKIKRDLSFIHTKNRLSSGISVQDFANNNQIPLSTAGQIYNAHGEEFLINYANDPYINRLELRILDLFKDQIEIVRWNKFPCEANIHYRPDFRLTKNNKIAYLNIDGIYYHTEDRVGKDYHLKLKETFANQNIKLFQFRSDELDDSSEIIKSIVLNYFDIAKKVRASSCKVRNVDQQLAQQFLDQNHLMGKVLNRPAVGLFNKEQLVCLLSYSIHDNTLEIDRFCTKLNTRVYGGFGKLLDFVVKLKNPSAIQSFCDLRYATGTSYKALGFDLESTTLGWRWATTNRTFNRLRCRANMDARGLSEKQHAEELGLKKIFDAGQARYVKVLDKQNYKSRTTESKSVEVSTPTAKSFWTKQQEKLLEQLFEQKFLRSEIIEQFGQIYPDKTPNAIIRKLSSLNLTNDRTITIHPGDKLNYWTVIEVYPRGAKILCECVCGTRKPVIKNYVQTGRTKSCGCKSVELSKKTSLERYGVERASKLDEIKAKIDQTNTDELHQHLDQ